MTRPTRLLRLASLAAALALAAAPVPVRAQSPAARAASAPAQTSAPASAPASGTTSLPADQEPAPPRTLRAYTHVWIAFTLVWIAMFGYALSLGRRFRKLEAEVDSLRATS
jgi:CcmD family protein